MDLNSNLIDFPLIVRPEVKGEYKRVTKELFVLGLGFTPGSKKSVLILSDEKSERAIPIWIAEPDAINISIAMMGPESKRPMTHETMFNVIRELDCTVDHVEITDVSNEIFFATIRLDAGDKMVELDARPSDAVALAVWSGAPVYVTSEVYIKRSVMLKVSSDGFYLVEQPESSSMNAEEDKEFREFLQNVKASDFGRDKS